MKITFDSRQEIARLSTILQDIYPAALCISTDDLLDARAFQNGQKPKHLPLPWNTDGFHLPIMLNVFEEDSAQRSENKGSCQIGSFEDGQMDMIFSCLKENLLSIQNAVELTGRSKEEIQYQYQLWKRMAEVDDD